MYEGNHVIDFTFHISGITQFHMLPVNDTNDEHITITCDLAARFLFTDISNIEIRDITFTYCSDTQFISIKELKVIASSFIERGTSFSTLSIDSSIAHVTDTQFMLTAIPILVRVPPSVGGAMAVTNSSLEIQSCVFLGNKAYHGGAIFGGTGSEIVIINSNFISNHAEGIRSLYFGGAIFIDGTSMLAIKNSTFENNTADFGGALAIVSRANDTENEFTYEVEGTTFSNNRANIEGGVLYVNGSDIGFTNCIISSNSAVERGGAIASNYSSVVRVIGSQIISNSAEMDGGVIVMQYNCSATIDNSTFEDNSAGGNGGVVYVQFFSDIEFTNGCSLVHNSATFLGGVVAAKNESSIVAESCMFQSNSAMSGGVFYATDYANISIADSKFFFNQAVTYGGVLLSTYNTSLQIDNSAFNGNSANFIGGVLRSEESCSGFINKSNFTYNRARVYAGVASVQVNDNVLIFDSSFRHNSVISNGGGVLDMNIQCSAGMYRCSFENNTASVGGDILILRDSTLLIKDSILTGSERKVDLGGCIRAAQRNEIIVQNCNFSDYLANYGGVMATVHNTTINITNTTFYNNSAASDGGVIYVRNIGYLVVTNSVFTGNRATNNGVVQAADNCSMTFNNITFINNTVQHDGGAAYAYFNTNVSIDNCTFINNTARNSGGVLYVRNNCNLTVGNCTIVGNEAQNSGGCIHGQDNSHIYVYDTSFTNNTGDVGGGIRMYVFSTAEVINCNFSGNVARVGGGAMGTYERSSIMIYGCNLMYNEANVGGGLIAFQSDKNSSRRELEISRTPQENVIEISKCSFTSNHGGSGGSMFVQGSNIRVVASTFSQSRATYAGGVINANSQSNIRVSDCNFMNTVAGTSGGVMSLYGASVLHMHNCTVINSTSVVYGGAVDMSQSSAHVSNSTFQSSSSNTDGGVLYVLNSTVHVDNSTFLNSTADQKGGAIYATILSNLILQYTSFSYSRAVNSSGGVLYCTFSSRCRVINSALTVNQAKDRGGAVYVKDMSIVLIVSSNFSSNVAEYGGALAARESSTFYTIGIYVIGQDPESVLINDNTAEYGGGIFLSDSEIYFGLRTDISRNNATASGGGIYADNSNISFIGSVVFAQNRAALDGGGISLLSSKWSANALTSNNVNFTSNHASLGGALFVSDNSYASVCPNNPQSEEKSGCFFQNITENFFINFANNNASLHGPDLYGGLLDRCAVSDQTMTRLELDGLQRFERISNIMNFSTVTSSPVRVCLCNAKMEPDCDQQTYYIQVKQRNSFVVPVVAVDHVNHFVPATIEAQFSGVSLSQSQRIQSIDETCSNVTYRVSFPQLTTYNLTLFPQGPCDDSGISKLSVVVNVVECSCFPGLVPSDSDDQCVCICDDRYDIFAEKISTCSSINGTVIRQGKFWIKYFDNINESISSPYFIHPFCPYDYCVSPSIPVSIALSLSNGSDKQCANSRGGLLCGHCLEGYSLSLGSSKCLQCSNSWHGPFVGILIAFVVAGVLLVIFLLYFNVTVAVGTLNSIVFFANILNINQSEYFSQPNLSFVPVFISWLNLDIGFDTCFIDGMDTYMKTWLQLAFPIYIIMLVFVIIWVSSCSLQFSKLIGMKNPVATLATLILLSYAKLLQIMIASFSFVSLTFPNGQKNYVGFVTQTLNIGQENLLHL
jgi:predicted outer membrane repeat protein